MCEAHWSVVLWLLLATFLKQRHIISYPLLSGTSPMAMDGISISTRDLVIFSLVPATLKKKECQIAF